MYIENKTLLVRHFESFLFFSFFYKVGELSDELKELPKRALLASAFITYLAQAPEDVRRNFMNTWSEALGVQHFDCRRFLSTESEQLIWKSEGLPSDELSMENALVILQVNYMHISLSSLQVMFNVQ